MGTYGGFSCLTNRKYKTLTVTVGAKSIFRAFFNDKSKVSVRNEMRMRKERFVLNLD